MTAVGNSRNKKLYRFFLLFLKFLPIFIASLVVVNTLLSYFDIDCWLLSYVGGISLLPTIFMYMAAYVFGFCFYHRIFLDYAVVSTLITIYDYYIGIPVSNAGILSIQLVLFFITCVIALIVHKYKMYAKTN